MLDLQKHNCNCVYVSLPLFQRQIAETVVCNDTCEIWLVCCTKGEVVLPLNKKIQAGTDHYIDDIIVYETVAPAAKVRKHLLKHGLVSKEQKRLNSP